MVSSASFSSSSVVALALSLIISFKMSNPYCVQRHQPTVRHPKPNYAGSRKKYVPWCHRIGHSHFVEHRHVFSGMTMFQVKKAPSNSANPVYRPWARWNALRPRVGRLGPRRKCPFSNFFVVFHFFFAAFLTSLGSRVFRFVAWFLSFF
jgi:hypothetical protein